MNILVTGGAGFIGSHLTDSLIKKNHRVIVVDNLSMGEKNNINSRAKFYKLNIRSKKIADIFKKEKPQIVFHLAAQMNVRVSLENPVFDAENNIIGMLNVLDQSVKFGVNKVIFASSGGAIYGDAKKRPTPENYLPNPVSPYGIAKYTGEQYLRFYKEKHSLDSVSLRLANVYGPRQDYTGEAGVIAVFSHNILQGKQCCIYGGRQTRDFVYISDVVSAFMKAFKKGSGIYNVGTGKETSINKLFKHIAALGIMSNQIIKPLYKPAITGEVGRSVLDTKRIRKELGWEQKVDLKNGLKQTLEYFKIQ